MRFASRGGASRDYACIVPPPVSARHYQGNVSDPAHLHKVKDIEGNPEDAEQRAPAARMGVDPAAE